MKKVLVVIDVQNDYFPGGKLPLWNTEATLENTVRALKAARAMEIPVVLVQQLTDPQVAPMFNPGTPGADIHPRVKAAAPEAPVIAKGFADSFHQTRLGETLASLGATTLLVCGMMTQNCVTHTAISKAAEKYEVLLLADCCTTVSQLIHNFALRAIATRLKVVSADEALG